ncbi:MAG: hypothetical protein R3263_07560 [Myxococcota bacterium]|nr:hypothetical protein [Myxococcota bacterium]
MDTDRLLDAGERGVHLLFDTAEISEAFAQDAEDLREALAGREHEIRFAVQHLESLPDVQEARRYVVSLGPPVRHILVLLYFEMLDGRLRDQRVLH